MTLAPAAFMRRFLLHVLPDGFQRIRHYGFCQRHVRGAQVRNKFGTVTLHPWITQNNNPIQ
jgi:hypothetical protein